MRLEFIVGVHTLIIAFISYIITITFSGWFEALIAKQVGDDVPEQAGFLTLNPLVHFNVFGFAAVLWGKFFGDLLPFKLIPGWGRHIPLVPDNIRGSHYKVLILIEYLARAWAHFIILMVGITLLMLLCGPSHVVLNTHELLFSIPHITLYKVMAQILLFMYEQNLVLFIIHAIIGLFKYLIYFYMPTIQELSFTTILSSFIILCLGLLIFGPLLHFFVTQCITSIQSMLLLFLS